MNRPDTDQPKRGLVADRRLYLTADRSAVVEESDPRCAWLLAGVGRVLSPDLVAQYGLQLVDGRIQIGGVSAPKVEAAPEVQPEPEADPAVDPATEPAPPAPEPPKAKAPKAPKQPKGS